VKSSTPLRLTLGVALLILTAAATPAPHAALPQGFVYLSDVAPSIVQDIRYAGYYNFVGKPIAGYDAPQCILTSAAARALADVERDLSDAALTIRVYDCYRPQRASDAMMKWSKDLTDQRMKLAFYPRVEKSQLGHLGYLAAHSDHSRGSAVDLTVERLPLRDLPAYVRGDPLHECVAPFGERFHDGSIDMGTTFNCFDELSSDGADIGPVAASHRQTLESVMHKHGFVGIKGEWWHYSLRWEPFPTTYFDFPIEAKPSR
jgi:D-alanyl-D-alanine dipeptidase